MTGVQTCALPIWPSGFGINTIPSGKAYIASNTWKVVVCVPLGGGTALSRITAANRVIAISVPNVTNGLSSAWQTYLTSPQKIEQDTGFTFFTALPADVAAVFRAEIDGAPSFSALTFTNNQFRFTVNGCGTDQFRPLIAHIVQRAAHRTPIHFRTIRMVQDRLIQTALALMSGCLLHADLKPHCMSTVSIPRALRTMAGTICVGAML